MSLQLRTFWGKGAATTLETIISLTYAEEPRSGKICLQTLHLYFPKLYAQSNIYFLCLLKNEF